MENSVADIEMSREGHIVYPEAGIEYPPALTGYSFSTLLTGHPVKIALALFIVAWILTKNPLKAFIIALAMLILYSFLN